MSRLIYIYVYILFRVFSVQLSDASEVQTVTQLPTDVNAHDLAVVTGECLLSKPFGLTPPFLLS